MVLFDLFMQIGRIQVITEDLDIRKFRLDMESVSNVLIVERARRVSIK